MPTLLTPVTIRLKHWREAFDRGDGTYGLTQAELAKRVKVSQVMISKIETDVIQSINLKLLGRLAAALGCEPRDLVSGADE